MIEDIYRTKLSREVLLQFLRDGTIPSLDDVNKGVEAIVQGRALNKPLLALDKRTISAPGERSSATKHNLTMDEIKRDLEVLYEAIFMAARGSTDLFDRTSIELALLQSRIKELEGRLSSLLLVQKDSEGYFNFVFDNFQDMSKVDQDNTTASVDLRGTTVHAAPDFRDKEHTVNETGELLIPRDLRKESANVLFSQKPVLAQEVVPGYPLSNMWNGSEQVALYRVTSRETGTVAVAFEVNLVYVEPRKLGEGGQVLDIDPTRNVQPPEWMEQFLASFDEGEPTGQLPAFSQQSDAFYFVTKATLNPHLATESGSITVNVQFRGTRFSDSAQTWKNIPSSDFMKDVSGKTSWNFTKTPMRRIRFIMMKDKHDRVENGVYVYDFGIKHLSLFAQDYHVSEETFVDTVLVSKALSAKDIDGNKVSFNKVSLEACEIVPEGTNIDYYVDFGIAGTFSGIWSPLSPLGRQEPVHPTVLYLDRVLTDDAASVSVDTVHPRGPGTTVSFPYYGSKHVRVLDYTISDTNDILSGWELWRNVVRIDDNYSVVDTTDEIVETGWRYDGTWYSCYINVAEAAGHTFNFGPNGLFVNDSFTKGTVTLSRGIHKIRTHRNNWHSLDGLNKITAFTEATKVFAGGRKKYNDDGLGQNTSTDDAANHTAHDPLYPYNHKLLLEGLDYAAGFPEEQKVYIGATRLASTLMEYVPPQDFASNADKNDLTHWTSTTIINDDSNDANYKKEATKPIFRTYKAESSEVPVVQSWEALRENFTMVRKRKNNTLADEIKLRAKFRTTNPNITPVLDDYIVKLGI